MNRAAAGALLVLTAALAACGPKGAPERQGNGQATAEIQTVDVPQTVTSEAPGTTPMAQRVAVIGLLNKRNGIERDLTMKPENVQQDVCLFDLLDYEGFDVRCVRLPFRAILHLVHCDQTAFLC